MPLGHTTNAKWFTEYSFGWQRVAEREDFAGKQGTDGLRNLQINGLYLKSSAILSSSFSRMRMLTTGMALAIRSGVFNNLFTTPVKFEPRWKWENIWLVEIAVSSWSSDITVPCRALPLSPLNAGLIRGAKLPATAGYN